MAGTEKKNIPNANVLDTSEPPFKHAPVEISWKSAAMPTAGLTAPRDGERSYSATRARKPARSVYLATYHSEAAQEYRAFPRLIRSLPAASRFSLAADPVSADWILYLEGDMRRDFLQLRRHPLVHQHFEKCYLFGHLASRLKPLPGVYTSVSHRQFASGRYRPVCHPTLGTRSGNRFLPDDYDDRPRRYFFSFTGAATSWVRRRLYRMPFKRPDVLIVNSSDYRHWEGDTNAEWQQRYVENILDSEFVLCPRGYGLGTMRLYEVMSLGRAPVLLADGCVLPEGPAWDDFCVRVAERDIAHLPRILEPYRPNATAMGQRARQAWESFFHPERQWVSLLTELERVATRLHRSRRREIMGWRLRIPVIRVEEFARRAAKRSLLAGCRLLGRPCPYSFQHLR